MGFFSKKKKKWKFKGVEQKINKIPEGRYYKNLEIKHEFPGVRAMECVNLIEFPKVSR